MRALLTTSITLPLLLSGQGQAHGITEPRHGGTVKVVGDVSLELVNGGHQLKVYILDDTAVDTSGMTGKIKVENSAGESEYELTPIEDSGLMAEGVSIPGGSEVLVVITKANGYSKIAGKFQVE
jgi:hypothetical protein